MRVLLALIAGLISVGTSVGAGGSRGADRQEIAGAAARAR
jgi:hypothetical protein